MLQRPQLLCENHSLGTGIHVVDLDLRSPAPSGIVRFRIVRAPVRAVAARQVKTLTVHARLWRFVLCVCLRLPILSRHTVTVRPPRA